MNICSARYAIFGERSPRFAATQVNEGNVPEWSEIEREMRGIFGRRHFANNGPLVRDLDTRLAAALGVRHAICVTNEMVAAMVLASALDISGDVVMPVTAKATFIKGFCMAGLHVLFCDIDIHSFAPTIEMYEAVVTKATSAFVGTHMFGRPGICNELELLASKAGFSVVFYAGMWLGCTIGKRMVGTCGIAEVLSFGTYGGEGAAIATNDDQLAARMRSIRNFHPNQTFTPVSFRINGKMSEAQAALVLAGLRSLPDYTQTIEQQYKQYADELNRIPGIALILMTSGALMSGEVVISIDEAVLGLSRDRLRDVLLAENIVSHNPVRVNLAGYPSANRLADSTLGLPSGGHLTTDDIVAICMLITDIAGDARDLTKALDAAL